MKTIKLTILSVLLIVANLSNVNAQYLQWAKNMGGDNLDHGFSITTDSFGNVYTTGFFSGMADFDPGPGTFNLISSGFQDVFISKLDASGNFVWAKNMGGGGFLTGRSITTDAAGNVYTTGNFSGTVDFDPGPGTFNLISWGSQDVFISKLNASGDFVWAKNMGGFDNDDGNSITTDDAGNVYTTGRFSGGADFDPGSIIFSLVSAGSNDIFISKLDASGDFVWAKQMGGSESDSGYSIITDGAGNVFTTGVFVGTADFDPGPDSFNLTSSGGNDIFISKLDASGDFVWAKQIGGSGSNKSLSISKDSFGNIYTTGQFIGTADFDPGPDSFNLTSANNGDVFISKLDSFGDFVWAKQIGGSGNDQGNSITIDKAGNIYTTGLFRDTTDFDPGSGVFNLVSAGFIDIFVLKMSPTPTVSIKEDSGTASFLMYPNPTAGNLIIDLDHHYSAVEVVIRNVLGQPVFQSISGPASRLELVIPGIPGIYFVEVVADGKKAVGKVIKE